MKILLIYPNNDGIGTIPLGLAMISAKLKEDRHKVFLFDSTFLSGGKTTTIKDQREEVGTHLKTDLSRYVKTVNVRPEEAFTEILNRIEPDIVGLSAVSYDFPEGLKYLEIAKSFNLKHSPLTIVGGTHASVAPEKTIAHKCVDLVCVGEGELAVSELCKKLEEKGDYSDVKNIWLKKDGKVIKNPLRAFAELDELPLPDFGLFDNSHFFKPFVGKIYRVGHLELSRGCPYQCSYCVNKHYQEIYRGLGKYHREKSIERCIKELKHTKEDYNINMIRFWDETFLLMKPQRFSAFLEAYKREVNLPFMIATRPETITEERVATLKDAGCVAISIGIESGNEIIRKKIMKRNIEEKSIIKAFNIANKYKIRSSSFNMVGLPFDTRRTVFDSIRLNRLAKPKTQVVNIFYPYEGTLLREISIKLGLIEEDTKMVSLQSDSVLQMPQMSKDEILALRRTFVLYSRLPKIFYPLIYLAEKKGRFANFIHRTLILLMQKLQNRAVNV